jgi:RHS repeat-associated protein
VQTFELTGFAASVGPYFEVSDLLAYDLSDRYVPSGTLTPVARKEYHEQAQAGVATRRIVEHSRTLFFRDDPQDAARYLKQAYALGTLGPLGLVFEQYKLALTESLLTRVFTASQLSQPTLNGGTVHDELRDPTRCGYVDGTGFYDTGTATAIIAKAADEYWMRSGLAGFANTAPQHFFLPERYTDAFGNLTQLTFDAFDLFVESSTDAANNTTSVSDFDYRVLMPRVIVDINANVSEAYFDLLGRLIAVARKGKGTEADDLGGYTESLANPSRPVLDAVFAAAPDDTTVRTMLADASSRFLYHFGDAVDGAGNRTWASRPAGSCTIVREEHAAAVRQRQLADPTAQTALQLSFECSDGSGEVLLKRAQGEPAATGGSRRWVVSGKTVLNNKGKPVKQYEPYFSTSAVCRAEGALQEEVGVTPLLYYDAAGRLVRTELPDGTITRVEFSPWHVTTYDANDTVLESSWYADRTPLPPDQPLPRNALTGAPLFTPDQRAAWLAARHANTPALSLLDSLGRSAVTIAQNRIVDAAGPLVFGGVQYLDEQYRTFTKLDAEGKALWIRDARGNLVMQYVLPSKPNDDPSDDVDPAAVPCYDVAGNLLYQHSMDAGDRWMLNDAAGKPVFAWDERGNFISTRYDELHRPTTVELTTSTHTSGIVVALTQYAGRTTEDVQYNRCGRARRTFDQSGLVTNNEFDFKGNALVISRRLANAYDADIDWSSVEGMALTAEPDTLLMGETFTQISEYDALSRPTLQYQWFLAGGDVAVVQPKYNERGLPFSTTLWIGATKTASSFTGGTRTTAVVSMSYDAKGQRLRTVLGNGVVATCTYDPKTFRLATLTSTRAPNDSLQALTYVYDPSGNVTEIDDDAVPAEFFDNTQVDATKRYEYDALYRLTAADGREHAGQNSTRPSGNWNDCPFRVPYAATDAKAWRNYSRRYEYDAVGNILEMRHVASGSSSQSWTRQYEYAVDSNRLLATGIGVPPVATHYPLGGPTLASVYQYNEHGSITAMPHLPQMDWDFTEHLRHISRSAASVGTGPDTCPDSSLEAWYRYDASKQRTRKRVVKQGGVVEERFYFGQVEWYRRWRNATVVEDIETVHLLDGGQRLLMVDQVRTSANGTSTLYRYTLSDHLGSSTVELDENSQIISFEEYRPYGTTAYQSGANAVEVRRKRYRYTGMERDEESGLSYHTARYTMLNIARWVSTDPSGVPNGINRYQLLASNPIRHVDRTGFAEGDSGEETRTVRPFLESFARSNRLRFITEVPIRIEVPGVGSVFGRPDYMFLMPRAKSYYPPFLFIETKGWNLQEWHGQQDIYVPALTSVRGAEVTFTSNRARSFGAGNEKTINVNWETYLILGRPNMADLPSAYAQFTSGKTYPYSFMSKTGEYKFAETQEEFYALLKQEGLNPLQMTPPNASKSPWLSGWQSRAGGTLAIGIFVFAMLAPKIAAAGVANKLERELKELEGPMAAARAENPDAWTVLKIQYAVDAPPEGITQEAGVTAQFRMVPSYTSPAGLIEAMEAEPQLNQDLLYVGYQRPQYLVIPPANMIQVPVVEAR